MNEATNQAQNVHASAVVVGEAGILIRGSSGRGKSALALALIELARERGLFGRLIGDDRVMIETCEGKALLSGAPQVTGLIERRGYGLENHAFERIAVARLAVDLLDEGAKAAAPAGGVGGERDARRDPVAAARFRRFDAAFRAGAGGACDARDEDDSFVTRITHFA